MQQDTDTLQRLHASAIFLCDLFLTVGHIRTLPSNAAAASHSRSNFRRVVLAFPTEECSWPNETRFFSDIWKYLTDPATIGQRRLAQCLHPNGYTHVGAMNTDVQDNGATNAAMSPCDLRSLCGPHVLLQLASVSRQRQW